MIKATCSIIYLYLDNNNQVNSPIALLCLQEDKIKTSVQTSYSINGIRKYYRAKTQNARVSGSPYVATHVSFCGNTIITNLRPLFIT